MSGTGELWSRHEEELERIARSGLHRILRHAPEASGPVIVRDGRQLVNLSSNNYLDLAADARITAAAGEAVREFGAGAGGSRLITGSAEIHRRLEKALARFKGTAEALVFSSGYLANLGLIGVLAHPAKGCRVPVVFDRLSHACVVDAAMLSGSPWRSFRHNDVSHLDETLCRIAAPPDDGHGYSAVVVTEGVFSMDGDLAPLPDILAVCERHNALLVVDDAHATGTIGPGGRGSAACHGVSGHPRLVIMGTLSKSLGAQGGFVAGPAILREALINRARPFIFETALAPPAAGAALAALQVIEDDPGRVAALAANAATLRGALRDAGHEIPESPSPVIPVIIGDAHRTLQASRVFAESGYLGVAIRPPTVPAGTSRIRLTVMSSHSPDVLRGAAAALAAFAQERMPSQ